MLSTLFKLAWVFLKIGTVSFGGGIVIIPMIEVDVVARHGWLTSQEFLDAITLSQVTPGPVVISATFIGYKAAGVLGALVATASVILPSFLMVCLATKAIKRFQNNKILANFFKGARIAVIAMVFEAGISIGRGSLTDVKMWVIAGLSILFLFRYKVNPIWVLFAAGVMGVFGKI